MVLLEVNTDAAKKNFFMADICFVRESRRVHRKKHYVMPARNKFRGQSIVPKATSAIHVCGAGGDVENLHLKRHRRAEKLCGRTDVRIDFLRAAGPN